MGRLWGIFTIHAQISTIRVQINKFRQKCAMVMVPFIPQLIFIKVCAYRPHYKSYRKA